MAFVVCNGALCQCSFGVAPTPLVCLPVNMVLTSKLPAATIFDTIPGVNIIPFGGCMQKLIAGVPVPCTFAPAGTWIPTRPQILIKQKPILLSDSMLMCAMGGVIKAIMPGEFIVNAK